MIPWFRLPDFQRESLRLIATTLLAATPLMNEPLTPSKQNSSRDRLSQLYFRHEIRLKKLQFAQPLTLIVSGSNLGAAAAADEMALLVGNVDVTPLEAARVSRVSLRGQRSSLVDRMRMSSRVSEIVQLPFASRPIGSVFFLYLTQDIFAGMLGLQLVRDVHAAIDAGMRIVLIHERNGAKGGCDFEHILLATPSSLLERDLYGPLASPWFTGTHREIGIKLTAEGLGAKAKVPGRAFSNRKLLQRLRESRPFKPHSTAILRDLELSAQSSADGSASASMRS